MSAPTVAWGERLLPLEASGAPLDLSGHTALHGTLRIPRHDDQTWREGMRRAVAESGLLGRGGAGFPTAAKWDAVHRDSRRPMVVVNAMEGEPASAKDRVLLTQSPHLVLDGAEVVAGVTGASEVAVCVNHQSGPAVASIKAAIDERDRAGVARCRISVQHPPGRYVTGEESALVNWLDTHQALPFLRIDKSVPLTIGRRSALVHNVETLSQVALIARYGPEWFRLLGTAEAPGSTLVTVTGAVGSPGVLEVELGTPVAELVARAGAETDLSAVLLGGYGGTWLDGSLLDTPYSPGPLTVAGATLGVGVVIALSATSCGIAETARIARYMAGQSAGQCGPCVFGLPAIADDLERLWTGRGGAELLERIETRTRLVEGRGACRHPDGVARLVRSALTVFAEDAWAHSHGRPCSVHAAPTVLTFPTVARERGAR